MFKLKCTPDPDTAAQEAAELLDLVPENENDALPPSSEL